MDVDEIETDKHIDGNTKKIRLFSAIAFRGSIKTTEKLTSLRQFLKLCSSPEKHRYIFEYFESGGDCLEILQTLDGQTDIPHAIVFEILTYLLLEISSKYTQLQRNACETCRHLLGNYVTPINKMLSLNSSDRERRIVLKLLAVTVTFSASLAKDVLLRANFNRANLEALTKNTHGHDSVRNTFLHFVTALLVDGHYPTISILLQKNILITSLIKGLQYDAAISVCEILTSLKNHVLLNPQISKTVKMQTFSTHIIKDIVNLYNWKGPNGYDPKHKKTDAIVNEYDKLKVNECTHDFLLVLCTSHRFGVIFRDHLVGLGKKTHNSLIYTVLESLERPWEHSYAAELVTKISRTCPDLMKTMWSNLKPFLEPRPTAKWSKAMTFAKNLLHELQPACIEFCFKELSIYQLTQITQMLVVPTQILKTLVPESCLFESLMVKLHVLRLLVEFLKSVESYMAFARDRLTAENFQSYKKLLGEHMTRNFPNALFVIANWKDAGKGDCSDDGFETCSTSEYLSVCFDLLILYEVHCVSLLDGLTNGTDLHEILAHITNTGSELSKFDDLQVKVINLLLSLDYNMFLPDNEMFACVIPSVLEYYYNTKTVSAYMVLRRLFENTDIFEGSEDEIDVWINSIFELKRFDRSISELLIAAVSLTYKKVIEFLTKFSKVKNDLVNATENIDTFKSVAVDQQKLLRHTNLSPLIFGVIKCERENSKSTKLYFSYAILNLLHLQTNPYILIQILTDNVHDGACSKHVLEYLLGWKNYEQPNMPLKLRGKLNLVPCLGQAIKESNVCVFVSDNESTLLTHKEQNSFLFQTSIFWLTNSARMNKLTLSQTQNCLQYVKYANTTASACNLRTVVSNPVLLQYFSPLKLHNATVNGFCTYFVKEVVSYYKMLRFDNLGAYLKDLRGKLYRSLIDASKTMDDFKALKMDEVLEVLTVFDLEFDQIYQLLENVTKLNFSMENTDVPNLLAYCLQQLCDNPRGRPLEPNLVTAVSKILSDANVTTKELNSTSKFAMSLASYLSLFPHSFEFVADELFESILTKTTGYCKENAALAALLLNKNITLTESLLKNVDDVSSKKGLMLPLIEAAIEKNADRDFLKKMYDAFEPSIVKALQKPQKAGQHFEKHFKAVGVLLKEFFPIQSCHSYVHSVQKYDVTVTFHSCLVEIIFDKAIFTAGNYEEKSLNNCLLTFVYLCMNLLKRKDENWDTVDGVAKIFGQFLEKICACPSTVAISYDQVQNSEVFRTFCKLCLKFGISGRDKLLMLLRLLLKFLKLQEDDAILLMEMLVSHSDFLEVILSETHHCKMETLSIISELTQQWDSVMQRSHIPIFLASYCATLMPSDRVTLSLLKRYESQPARTFFYDFKPFLWGPSAANHYSVRYETQKDLRRQPRMGDVLDIFQENLVKATIDRHCLELSLNNEDVPCNTEDVTKHTYDLTFVLPLFSSLLAPENVVQTHRFIKCGAFSLSVVALSSEDGDVRAAACHVLSRLYYHLEVNHHGKDNMLWLRFIEAICRGMFAVKDFKLNNFATVFLARMALILTNPTHVMYVSLSQYLVAKLVPDFSSIPELYTLLHSSDINSKLHQSFILKVIRDGLRTDRDFDVALHSMCFKLIMELFTSTLSDVDVQSLILDVIQRASQIPHGIKLLCSGYSLLSWLHQIVIRLKISCYCLLPSIIDILYSAARFLTTSCNLVALTLSSIIDNISIYNIEGHVLVRLLKSIVLIFDRSSEFLTEERLRRVISFVNNTECEYLLNYGSKYVCFDFNMEVEDDHQYYVKYLTLKWINRKR